MTEEKAKELLERFGQVQEKRAVRMCCPRCGMDSMRERLLTNALSRHAECYICPACGTDEAMHDYMRAPIALAQWDIVLCMDELNGNTDG